jgi:hypothetical protein
LEQDLKTIFYQDFNCRNKIFYQYLKNIFC